MKIPYFTNRRRIKEHFDWLIVRHASDHGDDDAILAMALYGVLNHELESMQEKLSKYRYIQDDAITHRQKVDHCRILNRKIKDLERQRHALLYTGYKIQRKRESIYYRATGNTRPPKFIMPWKKEKK